MYHPDVVPLEKDTRNIEEVQLEKAVVPMVWMQLLHSVRIFPQQSMAVSVKLMDTIAATESTWLLEPEGSLKQIRIHPKETLIRPMTDVMLVITNSSGFTQHLEEGLVVGIQFKQSVLWTRAPQ